MFPFFFTGLLEKSDYSKRITHRLNAIKLVSKAKGKSKRVCQKKKFTWQGLSEQYYPDQNTHTGHGTRMRHYIPHCKHKPTFIIS